LTVTEIFLSLLSSTFGLHVLWRLHHFHNSFVLSMMWRYLQPIRGGKVRVCSGVGKHHPRSHCRGLTEVGLWWSGGSHRLLIGQRFSSFICACKKDYAPHAVWLCLSRMSWSAWSGICHWAIILKRVCCSWNWWYGTKLVFNCLSSWKASALASSAGLAEDEPSTFWWAILSLCAIGSGALAIFNFWFGESPLCDSSLKTCVWWTRKVSPLPSSVCLEKLDSVS
jgi:hypothetical protein